MDGGFDIATDLGAVFSGCEGRLRHGDYAAIAPCAGRQGDEGFGQVGGAQLNLLAAGGLRPQHASLPQGAGVGVDEGDAQIERIGVDGKEGIGPCAGLMDVDIEAFCRQRDAGKIGTLAVDFRGCGLGFEFGVERGLSDVGHGLLFLVASDKGEGQQQGNRRKSTEF